MQVHTLCVSPSFPPSSKRLLFTFLRMLLLRKLSELGLTEGDFAPPVMSQGCLSPRRNNIPWIPILHDKGTIESAKNRNAACDWGSES